MTKINFLPGDFKRSVAKAGPLILLNRYFEQNPYLTDDGASLLARPGMRRFVDVGQGPIRGLASEAGSFDGDLFAVGYDTLYRIDNTGAVSTCGNGLYNPSTGFISMAITAKIGDDVPEYLFLADGRNLWLYIDNGYALNTLSGSPANTNEVRIDNTYYKFTSGSVNAGTPAGTSANPWLVAAGLTDAESFENLAACINADGAAGTQYSTSATENIVAMAISTSASNMVVRAKVAGPTGNGIVTTETGAGLTWSSGGTLAGGGSPTFTQVKVPDDVGAIDVAVVNSYVIVVPVQGGTINGRFYWIEPGETTIDPLNFATAESSPDELYGVKVLGDQFWLPGPTTTEVWYPTGDPETPMRRMQGVVFNRGTWQQTAGTLGSSLILCDTNGSVWQLQGGQPKRISSPDIAEQIREAIEYQQKFPLL